MINLTLHYFTLNFVKDPVSGEKKIVKGPFSGWKKLWSIFISVLYDKSNLSKTSQFLKFIILNKTTLIPKEQPGE